jgi:hypothetical protein
MKRLKFWWIMSVLVVAVVPAITWAQEGDAQDGEVTIATDRPSFSTGTPTVAANRLQLEAGFGFTFIDGFSVGDVAVPEQHIGSAPELLVRYGVADFAELRLQVPDISLDFAVNVHTSESTFGDLSLGAKLGTEVSDLVAVALVPFVAVGVENTNVSAGAVGAVDLGLTEQIGLTFNLVATNFDAGAAGRDFGFALSAAAGFGLTDQLGTYIEWHTTIGDDDVHFGQAGVTYLVTPQFQVDASVGTALPGVDTTFVGAGAATLF